MVESSSAVRVACNNAGGKCGKGEILVNAVKAIVVERDEFRSRQLVSIAWDRIVVGFIVFVLRLGLTNKERSILVFCFELVMIGG